MTSTPDDLPTDPLELDEEDTGDYVVPTEADPADVAEQHQSAGEPDESDYR
jgi:hypothetical protein